MDLWWNKKDILYQRIEEGDGYYIGGGKEFYLIFQIQIYNKCYKYKSKNKYLILEED